MHTFFIKNQNIAKINNIVELDQVESHHLSKVLRIKTQEIVELIDGLGNISEAKVTEINKKNVHLEIISSKYIEKNNQEFILALAWGKENRRSFVLEKSVELGASELWFWQANRSQFPLSSEIKDTWQTQLIAGAKQCQNAWLPLMQTLPNGIEELIEKSKNFENKIVLAEINATKIIELSDFNHQGKSICVVGPEGGFSPEEIKLLENNNFTMCSLGERILRLETAAILALGLNMCSKLQA